MAPGYEARAAIARLSRQTVITAINVLELMGLITVIRRIKRIKTALGFKTVQATNAFDIHPPGSRASGGIRLPLGGESVAECSTWRLGSGAFRGNCIAPKGSVFSKQEGSRNAMDRGG